MSDDTAGRRPGVAAHDLPRPSPPRDGAPSSDGSPAAERQRADPATHRVDVIRRLIARGASIRALEALLPGWEAEIVRAVEERDGGQLLPHSGPPV